MATKKKKLIVKKDTVKKLTDEDLSGAAGGLRKKETVISIDSPTCVGKRCCSGHTDVK